jgi:hypothetical protein
VTAFFSMMDEPGTEEAHKIIGGMVMIYSVNITFHQYPFWFRMYVLRIQETLATTSYDNETEII